jgi:hypothetical protein
MLSYLPELKSLWYLNLSRCESLTVNALRHVGQISSLRHLYLNELDLATEVKDLEYVILNRYENPDASWNRRYTLPHPLRFLHDGPTRNSLQLISICGCSYPLSSGTPVLVFPNVVNLKYGSMCQNVSMIRR